MGKVLLCKRNNTRNYGRSKGSRLRVQNNHHKKSAHLLKKEKLKFRKYPCKGQNEEVPLPIHEELEQRPLYNKHNQERNKRRYDHSMSLVDMRTYLIQKRKRDKEKGIAKKTHNEAEPAANQVMSKKDMEDRMIRTH